MVKVWILAQRSKITGTSPSDCLVSLSGHSLGESYPSAEMQSVYSTAIADWTRRILSDFWWTWWMGKRIEFIQFRCTCG